MSAPPATADPTGSKAPADFSTTEVLTTDRLRIVRAAPVHAALHAEYCQRNRVRLARWEPQQRAADDPSHWQSVLERAQTEQASGRELRLLALPREGTPQLIARINFSQINRGVFWSAMLGFAIDGTSEGRGLMFEALAASLDWAFAHVPLHRVQANHQPENERSGRLLARLGFVREGLAPQYLFINGAWRDHVLTARLNPVFDARLAGATSSSSSPPSP
jgi:[ribosomal protein S5]-alanine N-acetyltransferase